MLVLDDQHFVGKGAHKACYVHPDDNQKCVKVPFELPDKDVEDEIKYRTVLRKRNLVKPMLTECYGTVETDKGLGYIYEFVTDYDGQISLSLTDIFNTPGKAEEHLGVSNLEVMRRFREQWLKECVVVSDTDFNNYYVQKRSKQEFTFRIVDNIGSPVMIPLAYYFECFAKSRAKRYWRRLMQSYIDIFCDEKDLQEAKKLL